MKTCSKCSSEKSLDSFWKSKSTKDGYASYCKECASQYDKQYRANNSSKYQDASKERRLKALRYVREIKSQSKCCQCGESHIATLQFHHIDPDVKAHEISRMINQGFSTVLIQKEIDKCIILCANCHSKVHFREDI